MTYIERAKEAQEAKERERIKAELDRCAQMLANQQKQYAGQENCCPYGEE